MEDEHGIDEKILAVPVEELNPYYDRVENYTELPPIMREQIEHFFIDPCIPRLWPGFEMVFLYRSARYEIAVENPRGVSRGVSRLILDDKVLPQGESGISLVDDGTTHRVRVTLG